MCQLEGAAGNGFETEVNGGGTNLALRKLVYLLPLEEVRGGGTCHILQCYQHWTTHWGGTGWVVGWSLGEPF